MRPDEFFVDDIVTDAWGNPARHLDTIMLNRVRAGPLSDRDDIEVAGPLAILLHDELVKFGTDGTQELSEVEVRAAILAMRALQERLEVSSPEIPFRDFGSFKSYWVRNGGHGSWQARRTMLSGIFEPLHDQLALLEQKALSSTLAEPISAHGRTGWTAVDTEISELRRHFLSATTPQDYRGIGLDCVAVLEALSAQVYDPARHLRDGETEPPVANTKQRIERFIEDALAGSDNAALRKLGRASIEFAQQVKHSATPTRKEAGVAADAVIQLANMLRRLEEPE